jgi:hypothetical protein
MRKTKTEAASSSLACAETLLDHLSSLGLGVVAWLGQHLACNRNGSIRAVAWTEPQVMSCRSTTSRMDLAVVVVSRGINRLSCARREESSCCLRTVRPWRTATACGVQRDHTRHNAFTTRILVTTYSKLTTLQLVTVSVSENESGDSCHLSQLPC